MEDDDKSKLSEKLALLGQKLESAKDNNNEATPQDAELGNDEANQEEKIKECSVWIGNVDISVKKENLDSFFNCCGPIKRITIPVDWYSKRPKNYAYIEFENKESVANALKFDSHLLGGRNIKVMQKREVQHTTTPIPRRRRAFRKY